MTSTPFPGGAPSEEQHPEEHPEVEELSALTEELLSVERRRELHAHLSECALCADVHSSLADIRELLGTLPGSVAMPEDVASRIDAALAAEALLEAMTPEADGRSAVSRETVTAESVVSRETATSNRKKSSPSPKGRRPAEHAPASASSGIRSGSGPGSTRPGSSGPGRSRTGGRRRRWRTVTLAAAASLVALGLGGVVLQSLTDDGSAQVSSGPPDDSARRPPGTTSESTGSPDTGGSSDDQQLRRRVQNLLSHHKTTPPAESGDQSRRPTGTPTLSTKQSPGDGDRTLREDRTTGGAGVPSCVRNGIHRTEVPLAFDAEATFEGRTGYLVVLPHKGGDPQRVDAYVVDPTCVSAEGSGPGKILLKRTYPRG
ncbi:hypothetical protein [Streptomyces axinellae]|uniref:Zinc-finger domain-containing protein n=1 Tax=Streptomyces axinellae TaxID=552788 RepID=A0ABN3Q0E7_9ACTN